MPTILDVPDFAASLSTPLSADVFELRLDARVRAVLSAAGIATADYDPETVPASDDDDHARETGRAFWWVDVALGTVESFRRTVHGREETLERTDVSLHADRSGDEDVCGLRLQTSQCREVPSIWSTGLTTTFHAIVRGICDGALPDRFTGLRDGLPPFAAEALVREAAEGASVFDGMIEEWWTRGFEIDLPRLLASIESGATPSHKTSEPWAVVRGAERTRLLWPLVLEGFRVDIAYLGGPKWIATRYWLSIEITPAGAIDDVSVRTDEDHTWAAEEDPEPGGPSLADRISETAYGAIDFVNAFARREL